MYSYGLLLKPPGGYGISALSLIILILDIIVIVSIVGSHKTFLVKLVWVLVILFLPVLGLILYFFLGRERRVNASPGQLRSSRDAPRGGCPWP